MTGEANGGILWLTAQIISAHAGKNQIAATALPALIQSVYQTLATLGMVEPHPAALTPAVPIRKSVFPDYIVCLEDGKKLKMLKRHLQSTFGMTTDEYRTKWNLPNDYPMVAPDYASKRSELAHKFGLGRKPPTESGLEVEKPMTTEPAIILVPARRARGSRG